MNGNLTVAGHQLRRVQKRVAVYMLFAVIVCAGCGYRLARPDNPLLDGIETIAVPYFKNKTFEPGAEALFTNALVNEFIAGKRLRVVSEDSADVVVHGTIQKLLDTSLAYSADDKALHYRVRVTLDVYLQNRRTGEIVWKRSNMVHGEEFPVGAAIVISEAAKRSALTRLAEDLAERIHDSIMQGF